MKKFLALSLIVLVMVVISCGKKEVKKVSEESKMAVEAFDVAEKIKEAYIKKNFTAIEGYATKEGARSIIASMKGFDSAELEFRPVLVEIEGDLLHLNISWNGVWQKSGKTTEERGMAVFILKGKPLKLDSILRANPFVYPE
ncbi:MAG: hypothetical protein C0415_04575 [Thermodesulfovibrio sp.]|nr:hypothetical protein [Thermodesulfovibrio sp.]